MKKYYSAKVILFVAAALFTFTNTKAQVIFTVAGGGNGDGGIATSAPLNNPYSVATDASGNIYVADYGDNSIRKINSAGIISTIAGNGTRGFSGDGGQATAAELNYPVSIAFDGSGNLYISDAGNFRIRVVKTNGTISTYAGNGIQGYSGDSGLAINAELYSPVQIAFDHSTNLLYITDNGADCVRLVNRSTGVISTIAGSNANGFFGDGGAATLAQLSFPGGVAIDTAGNVYIADRGNSRVRMVNTSGIISTFAGNGTSGFNSDGGKADTSELGSPEQLAVDGNGNVYIADLSNNDIRMVNTNGIISTVAGNQTAGYGGDGASATVAQLNNPIGVSVDASGNIYIADTYNNVIREVNASGIISTIAGSNSSINFSGDGGLGKNAILNSPQGVARDKSGNIYFTDAGNQRVRELNISTNIVSTIAGDGTQNFMGDNGPAATAEFNNPQGIAIDDSGNIYIADQDNFRIRKITKATGIISTIAGNGISGYTGENGKADTAQVGYVGGIAIDTAGNVYFSDEENSIVREITKATGLMNTVAGIPLNSGYNGDGLASSTQLYFVTGLGVDKKGNVYFADAGNVLIRKLVISSDSIITIGGQYDNSGDPPIGNNVIATSIPDFWSPNNVTLDTAGNVYVTDGSNGSLVKIDKYDTLSLISGIGGVEGPTYNGDNIMANTADLNNPNGMAIDDSGNIFFADANNNRIREIRVSGPNITSQPQVNTNGCLGAPVAIGIGVSGTGATYQWMVDTTGTWQNLSNGGNYSGVNTDTLHLNVVSSTPDLTYRCVLNSGYVTSDSTVLVINTPTTFYIYADNGPDSICATSGEQLSLSTSANSIIWSNGSTSQYNYVSPGVTTTYTVSIIDGNGCKSSDSIVVPVFIHNLKANALPGTTVCKGTTVTLYAANGMNYYWSNTNNIDGGSNPYTFTADSNASYYVSGSELTSGCQDTNLIKIHVVNSPTVTASTTKDSVCQGGSVTLNGSGALTYSWSNDVSNNIPFSPASSTIYFLTGTDINGCTGTASVPVVVNPLPVVTASASPDLVCAGSSAVLSGNGGVSYAWSSGVSNNVPFVPVNSGSYTVTATSLLGCTNTAVVALTVDPKPVITASAFPSATLCQGSSLALFGAGGASYAWSGGVNNGVSFTPSASATYTITGIDANGCTNSDTINVTVHNKVVPTVSSVNTSCGLKNGSASVVASNGVPPYTYSWSTVPASSTASIDSLAAGTYVVSVSDSANCASSTAVAIASSTAPILSVASTNSNCGSVGTGSASVSVSGGTAPYHFIWNNGDTLTNDYNLKAGTYIITVKDVNGCSTFAPAIVSNDNGPKITVLSLVNVRCFGDASGSIAVSVSGGTGPYQYTWSNGASTASIGSLFAGPYQLTVMDVDSCISVQTFAVSQPKAQLALVASTVKADCGIADGSASVAVSGGSMPYLYKWSNGVSTAVDASVNAGVYGVIVTDDLGCIDSSVVAVSDKTGPTLVLSLKSNATCGAGGLISVLASGPNAPFSYLWSNGASATSVSNVPAGLYDVTVTDAHGCVSSADTTVAEVLPQVLPICMVTVDPIGGRHNFIIWNKTADKEIASYNVYKESTTAGVYFKIASIPSIDSTKFIDTLSDATVRSWRYELSQVDSCGNESALSPDHKTMHLTVNQGLGNNVNLIWDNYEGLAFNTYYVYRDTVSTSFTVIDSIPNNIFTYTDNSPLITKKPLLYRIGISNPGGCNPGARAEGINYNASKSNTGNLLFNPGASGVTAVNGLASSLVVFPNPATGLVTFALQLGKDGHELNLDVVNTLGQVVASHTYEAASGSFSKQIDLSSLAKGVYFFKITSNNYTSYSKVVLQ